jgi:putative transposase
VINRGNARAEVIHKDEAFGAFVRIMGEGRVRVPMHVVGRCLKPNMSISRSGPVANGDLSRWVHWLLTTHMRRSLCHHGHCERDWQGNSGP